MNQWNLTVRQALFASLYHTRVGHTEVLTRLFTKSHRSSMRQSSTCTARVYSCPYRTSRFEFGRQPTRSRMFMQRGANVSAPWSNSRAGPSSFSPPLPTFRYFQRDANGTRGAQRDEGWSTIMVEASAVAQRRDAVSCAAVPPLDENQAEQLVSSSTITKFSLGGEVFGRELRARDKKVAALMHSCAPLSLPAVPRIDRGLIFDPRTVCSESISASE